MQDFAAIDFETANNERSSVCSVGVVIVSGGEIVDSSILSSSPSQSIITTGAVRFMAFVLKTLTMRQSFPKYGSRLSHSSRDCHWWHITKHSMRVV